MKAAAWQAAFRPLSEVRMPQQARQRVLAALGDGGDGGAQAAGVGAGRPWLHGPAWWLAGLVVVVGLATAVVLGRGGLRGQQAVNPAGVPGGQRATGLPLDNLDMVSADSGWALTRKNAILRTENGGRAWHVVTPRDLRYPAYDHLQLTAVDASYAWLVAVHPTAGGPNQGTPPVVFRTTDGGRSWQSAQVKISGVQGAQADFVNHRTGFLLLDRANTPSGEEMTLLRSDDGGATWRILPAATAAISHVGGLFKGFTFSDAETGFVTFSELEAGFVTGHNNGPGVSLYATRDGGKTWQRETLAEPPGQTAAGSAARRLPPSSLTPHFFGPRDGILPVVFGSTVQSTVFYVTHDGGRTWRAGAGIPGGRARVAWSFADVNHGFAVVGRGFFRTDDSGRHWRQVQPNWNLQGAVELDFVSPTVGWAILVDGKLLHTADGGQTWAELTGPPLPVFSVTRGGPEPCPATPWTREAVGPSGAVAGPFVIGGFGGRRQAWIWGMSTKTVLGSPVDTPMDVTLAPHGAAGPRFVLNLPQSGVYLMQIPGPGCWDVTIRSGNVQGNAVIDMPEAVPTKVLVAAGRQRTPGSEVGDTTIAKDIVAALQRGVAGSWQASAGQPYRAFTVEYEAAAATVDHGIGYEVLYLPGPKPRLVAPLRLATGDACSDAVVEAPVTTPVMRWLQREGLAGATTRMPADFPSPDAQFGANCMHFHAVGTASVPQITWIKMASAVTGWAVTEDGSLLQTGDGGHSWSIATPPGLRVVDRPHFGKTSGCAHPRCFAGWMLANSGAATLTWLYMTKYDGGILWLNRRETVAQHASVGFVTPDAGWKLVPEGWAHVHTGGGTATVETERLLRTTDGGFTWTRVASVGPGPACVGAPFPACLAHEEEPGLLPAAGPVDVSFTSPDRGWAAETAVAAPPLYTSADGGRSWHPVSLPGLPAPAAGRSARALSPRFFSPQNGLVLVAVQWLSGVHGAGNHVQYDVYTTHDGGRSWRRATPISVADPGTRWPAPAWSFIDPQRGWIAVAGHLFATDDGGTTWRTSAVSALRGTDDELDFTGPQTGWAIVSSGLPGQVQSQLLRTLDGGTTWSVVPVEVKP